MRTIPRFIVLVILFLAPLKGFGESFPYIFSFGAGGGFLAGQSEEIVYASARESVYLSQLLWDMKVLWYMGVEAGFQKRDLFAGWGFFGEGAFRFGMPAETGRMEDRDWISEDRHLTHYSAHQNSTTQAYLLDFTFGATFSVFSWGVLKVYGTFSYMSFAWAAKDGFLEYENENWERRDVTGPTINYTQQWFLLAPGIGLWVPFLRYFSGELRFEVSPLIYCAAKDEHLMREIVFYDQSYAGIYLEPAFTLRFAPKKATEFRFTVNYRFIAGTRGTTKEHYRGTVTGGSTAGAGYSVLDAGFGVTFYL